MAIESGRMSWKEKSALCTLNRWCQMQLWRDIFFVYSRVNICMQSAFSMIKLFRINSFYIEKKISLLQKCSSASREMRTKKKQGEISIAEWRSHLISTFPRSIKTTANNKSNLQDEKKI